ncbi:hypothetical protein F0344_06990 [Streptomyces finlayi]|uniref:Uncharacterized protein n=1 Tax=Streptomyces finlayi TaxID=67296 RepID=A0A7G7BUT7_9ACTN|nr:hypothetical protein F0344_06990 [Streptomyces finlayi]
MVRRLAERQGGSAAVTTAAAGGAVFTVVLPEALRHPGAPDAKRPDSPLATTGEAP